MSLLSILLLKDHEDRNRKDLQLIEDQLICLHYFDQLQSKIKPNVYKAILKAMSLNATIVKYDQGQLIWRFNEKQDKLLILLTGTVQEYIKLTEQELDSKKKKLIQQFKTVDIFTERPGRKIHIKYGEDNSINISINDNSRMRRPQLYSQQLTRMNSSQYVAPEVSFGYQQYFNQEMQALLNGVQLNNELLFEYFLNNTICNVKQGNIYYEGDLLNQNINNKKQETQLLCLKDSIVIQMNLVDYQNVELSIKLQKQSKIYRQLEAAFISESIPAENEMHNLVKQLMNKYKKIKFNPHNIIYSQGEELQYIYVLIQGECEISNPKQITILAKVNQGCLIGEESFGLDYHLYKCIATTECKLYAVPIQDIMMLCSRYQWFKQQLEIKQLIKSKWLVNRQITQKIQTSQRRIRGISQQFYVNQRRPNKVIYSEKSLKNSKQGRSQNIFDECQQQELGFYSQRTSHQPSKYSTPEKLMSQKTRFLLRFNNSQPNLQQKQQDLDVVPILMTLNKQQSELLKDIIKKRKIKQFKEGSDRNSKMSELMKRIINLKNIKSQQI